MTIEGTECTTAVDFHQWHQFREIGELFVECLAYSTMYENKEVIVHLRAFDWTTNGEDIIYFEGLRLGVEIAGNSNSFLWPVHLRDLVLLHTNNVVFPFISRHVVLKCMCLIR